VPGTDGARYPFWSPDSRSVGFFADGKLKRIDTISGSVQELADAPNARGGTWNADDVILFVPSFSSGVILSISANGGETSHVMRSATLMPRFPQFLPDGLHFLYGVGGGDAMTNGLYVGQLDDPATERLLAGAAHAVYASPRRLLFVREGTLVAQDFDPATRTLSGRAFPVAQQISIDPAATAVAVSASAAGPIIYRSNAADAERHYVWVDRSGTEVGRLDEAERDDAAPARPSLSPDGRVLAVHRRSREGNWDVWLLQMGSGLFQRFTTDRALDLFPIWSPDATRVVFSSNRTQRSGLYEIRTTADSGSERLLFAGAATPMDWSLDGRFLLYNITSATGDLDLWALPMLGEAKPVAVVQTGFAESDGQFSPDGKWIAYQSNESGRPEIYIQPFPGPGGKQLVSTNGGVQVRWRRNGEELFYIAPDGRLMAVTIRLATDGTSFERDAPVPLFTTREVGARQGLVRQQYAVSADGQRFLMNTITKEATSPITVILNWNASRH
jgi:Tol biopolymer transport system component